MNSLVLLVALPLLAAFLQPIVSRISEGLGRWFGPVILVITAGIGLQAWGHIGAAVALNIGGFRAPFGIVFYVDHLALLFALAVSIGALLLWPRGQRPDAVREYTLTLVLVAAASGLAISGDLFNLYVFYELASVASFGLVAAQRSGASFAASIRYAIISSIGAVLAFIGVALVYLQAGTLNLAQLAQLSEGRLDGPLGLAAFVFLLIGFGVKAELFPINTWVPEAYATASKRVAGLLAGVISKLALLIVVRLLVLVYDQQAAQLIMLSLGIAGIVTGELAAWRARDLTRMLAYSSIGQLGMIFVAFSIPGKAGVLAGLAVALHHLVVKPALFLLAEQWGGSLARLRGVGKTSPFAAVLFTILALSLIGVPPLPGFWAKLLVMIHLMNQGNALYQVGMVAIMFAAVLETSYLFRLIVTFYGPRPETPAVAPHHFLDLGAASVLSAALLAAAVYMGPLERSLDGIAGAATDTVAYISTVGPRARPSME